MRKILPSRFLKKQWVRNSVENQSEWCLIHVSNKSRYSVVLELLAIFVSPDSVSQLWNEYSIISNNRSFYLHNWNVIVWWNLLSLTQSLFSIDTVVWFKKSVLFQWNCTGVRPVLAEYCSCQYTVMSFYQHINIYMNFF